MPSVDFVFVSPQTPPAGNAVNFAWDESTSVVVDITTDDAVCTIEGQVIVQGALAVTTEDAVVAIDGQVIAQGRIQATTEDATVLIAGAVVPVSELALALVTDDAVVLFTDALPPESDIAISIVTDDAICAIVGDVRDAIDPSVFVNDGRVTYHAVLSAAGETDIEVPMKSFTARLRQSPQKSSVTAVIPSILNHVDEITARATGEITVIHRLTTGGTFVDTEIIRANTQAVRQYEGAEQRTGEIYADMQDTFSAQTTSIQTARYRSTSDGTTRIRSLVVPELKPAHTAQTPRGDITVAEITITCNPTLAQMEFTDG